MRRALTGAAKEARGVLLEKYGAPRLWQREGFPDPVRIVDASPRRNTPHYLGWVHTSGEFTDTVRWINQTNFDRFYREVEQ